MDPLYSTALGFSPRKGDLRKIEIIESAIHCLATDGVEKTTFEAIGKRIGLSKSHVAYHFPDLDDLIESCIRLAAVNGTQITVDKLKGKTNWEDQLRAIVEGAFAWAEQFPEHLKVLILFYYRSSYQQRFRDINTEFRQMGARRLLRVLEGELDKRGRSPAQRMNLARRIQALVFGSLIDSVAVTHKKTRRALEAQALLAVRHLIQGELGE
jgi:AcrR family transcriptional regulator